MPEFSVIGHPVAMVDAPRKTTGAGQYTDDLAVEGMLFGKILHSHLPHARIRSIDASAALALPGVRCVITGADAPTAYGVLPIGKDECALQPDKARYIGDNIACVVAESERAAAAALPLVRVDYEPLPAYFDPEAAMAAPEAGWLHARRSRNIEKEYHHVFGDPDAAMAQAAVVCRHRYACPAVTHAAMEPHATLARFEPDGNLTVWSSTQVPYYLQKTLARVLQMPMERIRVIKPMVGGGFGGKSEVCPLEIVTAVAARRAGAPVKIVYSREEVFYTHRGRPLQITELETGAARDGTILAVRAKVIQDGGAYCGYGPVTLLYSGALLGAMYDIPHVRWDGYRVLTNKPACGAMRGHGTVNTRFAFEAQLDELAERLGLDPAELRRRNFLRSPCVTVNGLRVQSYGLPECLEKVVAASGWDAHRRRERRGKLPAGLAASLPVGNGVRRPAELSPAGTPAAGLPQSPAPPPALAWPDPPLPAPRHGFGVACSHYVSGAANAVDRADAVHSTVFVEASADGQVTVLTGTAEIGQGSDTMQAQVVAEALGLPLPGMTVIAADSAVTPMDLGSYSSRVTFMAGNAALRAAEDLKRQIAAALAAPWGCPPEAICFHHGHAGFQGHAMPWAQAVAAALPPGAARLRGTGTYSPPKDAQGGDFKGAGVGPSPAYSYSAQVAEVSVDETTGQVTVHKVWAAHDCGRALNPITVEGQVIGSVWMGLGQALSEEMAYTRGGQLANPTLLDYRVPTILDSPPIEAFIVESVDPEGPFGAKEAGEGSLAAVIPAIANAIYDAAGIRLYEPPFTPDRVLRALRAARSPIGQASSPPDHPAPRS
ncbi:MAG: molybdopterin cofactor-binding domain-containing protein [Terriglobales bacterium]